jgi:hypothetical protein
MRKFDSINSKVQMMFSSSSDTIESTYPDNSIIVKSSNIVNHTLDSICKFLVTDTTHLALVSYCKKDTATKERLWLKNEILIKIKQNDTILDISQVL